MLPRKGCATHFPPLIQRVAIKARDPYDSLIGDRLGMIPKSGYRFSEKIMPKE
jgi:hypothetical protein